MHWICKRTECIEFVKEQNALNLLKNRILWICYRTEYIEFVKEKNALNLLKNWIH